MAKNLIVIRIVQEIIGSNKTSQATIDGLEDTFIGAGTTPSDAITDLLRIVDEHKKLSNIINGRRGMHYHPEIKDQIKEIDSLIGGF